MLDIVNARDFAAHLNQDFKVLAQGQELDFVLIEATPNPQYRAPGFREPFSVIFRGPMSPALNQGMVRMKHQRMGDFTLFIAPLGPDQRGMIYQAVFN